MLNKLGFTVITANNGKEAIAIFKESFHEIDCVMLDVAMAPKDGFTTLKELKIINPDACIIMMSGFSENQVKPHLSGADIGFIQKPYRLDNLRAVLQSTIR